MNHQDSQVTVEQNSTLSKQEGDSKLEKSLSGGSNLRRILNEISPISRPGSCENSLFLNTKYSNMLDSVKQAQEKEREEDEDLERMEGDPVDAPSYLKNRKTFKNTSQLISCKEEVFGTVIEKTNESSTGEDPEAGDSPADNNSVLISECSLQIVEPLKTEDIDIKLFDLTEEEKEPAEDDDRIKKYHERIRSAISTIAQRKAQQKSMRPAQTED